jgi:acyl phosphate:glycerol-3-phosphate acyltransferase
MGGMTLAAWTILIALFGYVAGATPFGYLTARFVAGIDIRRAGSGNIGATNIGRVLGAKWGVAVLALDCLKGLIPVLVAARLIPAEFAADSLHLQVLCGLCTVVGHMFPFWLRFRGGKGVATALGVVLVLGPWAVLVAFGVFLLVFLAWRMVSLSSIAAAVAYALVQMFLLKPHPFAAEAWSAGAFSLLVPALILWRHRSNMARIWRGEEERFAFGGKNKSPHAEGATEGFAEANGTADNGESPNGSQGANGSGGNGVAGDLAADQQVAQPTD